jgi:hypothetical protein
VRFARRLNGAGYLHFRHWQVYAERGLARQIVGLWLYEENLTVEFRDEPLAQYAVKYQPDHKHFTAMQNVRLLETQYRLPQLMLWQAGEVEWHLVQRDPERLRRRRPPITARQLPLFDREHTGS